MCTTIPPRLCRPDCLPQLPNGLPANRYYTQTGFPDHADARNQLVSRFAGNERSQWQCEPADGSPLCADGRTVRRGADGRCGRNCGSPSCGAVDRPVPLSQQSQWRLSARRPSSTTGSLPSGKITPSSVSTEPSPSADSLFARYTFDDDYQHVPYGNLNNLDTGTGYPQFTTVGRSRNQWLTFGENHIFSPALLNSFRFCWCRTNFSNWQSNFVTNLNPFGLCRLRPASHLVQLPDRSG